MQTHLRAYPAFVFATDTIKERWDLIRRGVQECGWWSTGNFSSPPIGSEPYGVDGYKTISFEIYEQLDGKVPDYLICPVSYGDGLFGIWKGFYELTQAGLTETIPKMVAAECSFAGPLTNAIAKGLDFVEEVPAGKPSIAYTISVTNSTYHALKCIKDSGGTAVKVDDTEIFEAQRSLLNEGIYVEPTAAVALAAAKKLAHSGYLKEGRKIVIILTSAGVKHQEHIITSQKPIQRVTSFNQLEELWSQANS
jgi:threonine synthase